MRFCDTYTYISTSKIIGVIVGEEKVCMPKWVVLSSIGKVITDLLFFFFLNSGVLSNIPMLRKGVPLFFCSFSGYT